MHVQYIFTIFSSTSYTKVIGSSSRSQEQTGRLYTLPSTDRKSRLISVTLCQAAVNEVSLVTGDLLQGRTQDRADGAKAPPPSEIP